MGRQYPKELSFHSKDAKGDHARKSVLQYRQRAKVLLFEPKPIEGKEPRISDSNATVNQFQGLYSVQELLQRPRFPVSLCSRGPSNFLVQ